jgi:DNA-binding protein H-NS
VRRWEYKKIALNETPRRRDDIDLLCDAGDEGWELVAVLPHAVAYLKRGLDDYGAVEKEEPAPREESVVSAREVKAKYRDPATGEAWSGRGRMASWLKRKQDAGENIEKYLV